MDRTTVNVLSVSGEAAGTVERPKLFGTPIRPDLVQHIFTNVSKNSMQPHATKQAAGHGATAESWGPGRAKARVPRVNGSGSNRNGQGAYANFCRGGHRFGAPTLLRRWYRPVPTKMVNYAIASAIAASAVTSFVQQRGHIIDAVKEVPIVVANEVESFKKTKEAVTLLKAIGCYEDVKRVMNGKIHRSTKGKYRRSAFRTKKGPLVVYYNDNGISKAFRNIPGVDCIHVSKIELKHFAPGSQIGRLTIWTQDAFEKLDAVFEAERKFKTPRSIITNTDIERIINSEEIQSVLRPKLAPVPLPKGRTEDLVAAGEEWAAAFKKIEEIKAEELARKQSPEAIQALFKSVIENLPQSPENLSNQIMDHALE